MIAVSRLVNIVFNNLEKSGCYDWMSTSVHDPLATGSNEKTYLQYFLVILKNMLQGYRKKCFLGNTSTAMASTNMGNVLPVLLQNN